MARTTFRYALRKQRELTIQEREEEAYLFALMLVIFFIAGLCFGALIFPL